MIFGWWFWADWADLSAAIGGDFGRISPPLVVLLLQLRHLLLHILLLLLHLGLITYLGLISHMVDDFFFFLFFEERI